MKNFERSLKVGVITVPNQELRYAIGVDLGGTKIALGIVDETGKIIDKRRLKTDVQGGVQAIEREIVNCINDFRSKNCFSFKGVGIGIPGQIDLKGEIVLFAPNLYWNNVSLKKSLEKALQIPVVLMNDVRAITYGEWQYGAGRGCQDILGIYIGTGIGGGIVSGGHLLGGSTNSFGEVGHMTIDYKGPLCTCGKKGCFEAVVGGWGIAKNAQSAINNDKTGSSSKILALAEGDIQKVSAKIVIDAYREKDPFAEILIKEVKQGLITGLSSLINLYNPQRLILGGGVLEGVPEWIPFLETEVKKEGLQAATQSLEVTKGILGEDAGIIGMAAAIFKKEEK